MCITFWGIGRILAVGVALLITGCSLPSLERSDPESFTMLNVALPQETVRASQFETIGQRPLPNGQVIVPYRFTRTPAATGEKERFLGYGLVVRRWLDWHMIAADTIKCTASVPTDRVAFATSQVHGDQDETLIYGETLDADVVTVEAILTDGHVLQDNSADGIFVLFDAEGRTAQELRVLDQNGRVLEIHEITDMHACH